MSKKSICKTCQFYQELTTTENTEVKKYCLHNGVVNINKILKCNRYLETIKEPLVYIPFQRKEENHPCIGCSIYKDIIAGKMVACNCSIPYITRTVD